VACKRYPIANPKPKVPTMQTHGPYRKGANHTATYVAPYSVHSVTCPTHPRVADQLFGLYCRGRRGVLMLAQGPTGVDTLVEAAYKALGGA
jgi:hypothetical protein